MRTSEAESNGAEICCCVAVRVCCPVGFPEGRRRRRRIFFKSGVAISWRDWKGARSKEFGAQDATRGRKGGRVEERN